MLKSEFLQRLSKAAHELMGKYNGGGADKKTFNWNLQSVYYAKVANLFFPVSEGDEANNPVAVLIRRIARASTFGAFNLETLIKIEKAWEYYEQKAKEEAFSRHVDEMAGG